MIIRQAMLITGDPLPNSVSPVSFQALCFADVPPHRPCAQMVLARIGGGRGHDCGWSGQGCREP